MKNKMKEIREKAKAIWHIITDKEYAIYTVTTKDNKRVRTCCIISDNASKTFLKCIVEFTQKYNPKNKSGKDK